MSLTNKQAEALIRLSRVVKDNFPSLEEAAKGVTDAMKDKSKKQIEWKNGDKCVWNTKKCVFVGVSCVSGGLAVVEVGDGAVLEKVVTERVRISELQKPKEKRWLVYDAKGTFCSEHDYPYEPFDETLQVIRIEINV